MEWAGRITIEIVDEQTAEDPRRVAWMLRLMADQIESGEVASKGEDWRGNIWPRDPKDSFSPQALLARYRWQQRPEGWRAVSRKVF